MPLDTRNVVFDRASSVRALVPLLLLVAVAAGCRSNPVGLSSAASSAEALRLGAPARTAPKAPPVQGIVARYDESAFTLVARYSPLGLRDVPEFSAEVPGGWCYQLFLDVDGPETGFGGFDYVVRSMERDAEGRVALRRTEGGGGPGGWGDRVAWVPMAVDHRHLGVVVPLEALGDDGRLSYVLELYATVPGDETPVSHVFTTNFSGVSSGRGNEFLPTAGTRAIALQATLAR